MQNPKTKLQTIASHLLSHGQVDQLVELINTSLNGNRTIHAVRQGGQVFIGQRKRPDDEMVYAVSVDEDGNFAGGTLSERAISQIEKGISIRDLARAEDGGLDTPSVSKMLTILTISEKDVKKAPKGRLSKLRMGNRLETIVYGLKEISKVVDLDAIVVAMNRYRYQGVKFVQTDGISMVNDEGQELASIRFSNGWTPEIKVSGHVAAKTFHSVIVASVAGLDETLGLVERLEKREEAENKRRAEEQAQRKAEREQRALERANALIQQVHVPAGELFVMRRREYHEDHGEWFDYDTVLRAEKDIDAFGYVRIMSGDMEGLAEEVNLMVLRAGHEELRNLREALMKVHGRDGDDFGILDDVETGPER